MLNGYKTYIISFLTLIVVVTDGLANNKWDSQLAALALLAATIRHAINTRA